MRLVKIAVLLAVLLALAACGYVEGNYPPLKGQAPVLPDTWKQPQTGEEMPVVWENAPQWRGFFAGWMDLDQLLPMIEMGAEQGRRDAAAVRSAVETAVDENLQGFAIALFLHPDAEPKLRKGSLLVEFTDGTSSRDQGVYFLEMHKSGPRLRSTYDGRQTLKSEYSETGKPLIITVTVPQEHFNKTVGGIRLRT